MADQLPGIATETGRKLHGKVYRSGETPLVSGDAVELMPEGADEFALSNDERETYGLREGEEHVWIRNPKYWEQIEMKDRAREFLGEGRRVNRELGITEGARRIIKLSGGEYVTSGDLILAAKPRAEREAAERMQRESTEEYLEAVENGSIEGVQRFNRATDNEMQDRALQQHRQNVASGLIGPTSGLDYVEAMRHDGAFDKLKREQAFHRSGGRRQSPTGEAEEARMAGAREGGASGAAAGRTISIPATVRPRNNGYVKR